MRNQPSFRALRVTLFAVLLIAAGCGNPAPEMAPDKSKDAADAAGVDAEFSVQTFALGAPTLKILLPTEAKYYFVDYTAPTPVKVNLSFDIQNFTVGANQGQVLCKADGKEPPYAALGTTLTNVDLGTSMGMHTIVCTLASATGQLVSDASATAVVHVHVSQDPFSNASVNKCLNGAACDDGKACSQQDCVDAKCVYSYIPNCCADSGECSPGLTCVGAGAASAKCSSCTGNLDCEDNNTCTNNVCDLSGPVGKCNFPKPDPECCVDATDPCDDGQSCTVDSCDVASGKCQHTKPAGVCCSDAECVTSDPCGVGACVDNECRFGKDKFKPGCCEADADCNDNNYCTIDKCPATVGPDGFKACTHEQDPAKGGVGVCCDMAGNNLQCDDGNDCTLDFCNAYKCVHKDVGTCCLADIDCDDQDNCTVDKCTIDPASPNSGKCSNTLKEACCNQKQECNDNKFCTIDTCDYAAYTCNFIKPDPGCCDTDADCNDGKFCTADICVNHVCIYGPDKFKAPCCESNAECNDANPCTIDTCDVATNKCQFVSSGDPECCQDSLDCDDGDCTTTDFCDGFNKCKYATTPDLCKGNADCDDGDPCTIDACDTSGACGKCTHKQDIQCCKYDFECDDSKSVGGSAPNPKAVCTLDKCVDGKCSNTAKADCCVDDADAVKACDDNNACTIDYCLNNSCRHTVPKGGCCATNADCFDGNKCTTDSCQNIVDGKGTCAFALQPGCKCAAAEDCNDNNTCTADSCVGGLCVNKAIDNCCLDKFDCDDGAPCTYDFCVFNECAHPLNNGDQKLCCQVATQDSDCAYLNAECAKGICEVQFDGSTKCVAKQLDVCTVNINYCQDFQSGTSLPAMGWNPTDLAAGKAAGNWKVATDTGLGPDQHAKLDWTPTVINFETCLQSPIIQAAGAKTITLQYDREFIPNGDSFQISVYGSLGGANPDWTKAQIISSLPGQGDPLGPEGIDVQLPPTLSGSNGLRLAFCVSGNSTFDLTHFALDNICIAKGVKPAMSCATNQVVPYGTKKTIPFKAVDGDPDAILSFQLVSAPEFVTLSSAMYYWLDGTWNSTLTIQPTKLSHIGTFPVTVKVSDGLLYSLCTFEVTVTYQGGYLVYRPAEVPKSLGDALFNALKAQNLIVQHVTDLGLYPSLTPFQGIFVTLGAYPNNHVLTDAEAKALQTYLAGTGKLYLEGADTWFFDPPTTLHPTFNAQGKADSTPAGITGPLLGAGMYKDVTSSPAKVYTFGYDKDGPYNNENDVLSAKTNVTRTKNVLTNDNADKAVVQVGHDNPLGYRTVASSVMFGAVTAGPGGDTPNQMVQRILHFFANGFVECLVGEQCDDGDGCTVDTCVANICNYKNTCTCAGEVAIGCGETKTITSNGAGSTNTVKSYGCDANGVYDGKEFGLKYTAKSSAPIVVKVSNLSNPAARLFVLKGNNGACDSKQCIGYGAGEFTFAGAAGNEYFLVLDVPNNGVAQADVQINCGAAENCIDGIDNNGNGLVDCSDLGSCCGDAACGEVCDGKDNDCDGAIDDGCDDDADGYCDAKMTVVGTPAVCTKGKDDCDDTNVNVNPGVLEICANSKDDNCSGAQDEEGAEGCANMWTDLDGDAFGAGIPKCLCAPSGTFKATKSGDCKDDNVKVNPSMTEICGNGLDDDCSGSQNDQNAQGCSTFYTDIDQDGWGALPSKCLCFGAGATSATKITDCNDNNQAINQDAAESCNDQDDNCNGKVDEGCDDDKDGYCDLNLGFTSIGGTTTVCGTAAQNQNLTLDCGAGNTITAVAFASYGNPTGVCKNFANGSCNASSSVQKIKDLCLGKSNCTIAATNTTFGGDPCVGTSKQLFVQVTCTGDSGVPPQICPKGAGDSDDLDPQINPAGKEICDNKDNDSDGLIDEGCDDDKDGFCDKTMVLVGAPTVCPKGGLDCDDNVGTVNPGAVENCNTPADDDCNGTNNDLDGANCTIFFYDGDGDAYGTKQFKCYCAPVGLFKAKKTADCDDTKASINPGALEVCDNIDNNCTGSVDEGCDDDQDGYCDALQGVAAGGSAACPNGGGDCDDAKVAVNPGKAEICGNALDDDCSGTQNDPGAIGCSNFYGDGDGDGFGSTSGKCLCEPAGSFVVSNKDDCDDSNKSISPLGFEICDDKDNNCDGTVDEGCDDDNDDYCEAGMALTQASTCSKGGNDCNDDDGTVNPGMAVETCNDIDDDCDGVVDNGCDDDKDGWCDAGYNVANPLPAVCQQGTGDCDDFDSDRNPGAAEVCGDGIDNNCNDSQNDEGALNCKQLYFDGDLDGAGLNISKCLCEPVGGFSAPVGDDCDDSTATVKPGATEVCGDGVDNDCDGDDNDENAQGCQAFFLDTDKDGYGLGLSKCFCVEKDTFSAPVGGDCNDTAAAVNPGKDELCNNVDDNCKQGIDEGCNNDSDDYCDAAMVTVGLPLICPLGGGDCDDTNANASPGKSEVCDDIDNNCNGSKDEGCNDDGDTFCDAAMVTVGKPKTCTAGGGDCNDSAATVNPGAPELCATPIDDNCNGDTNDENATGCVSYGLDTDGDTYGDVNAVNKCLCKFVSPYSGTKLNDCNDKNNLINPAMPELCDGVDNNCNGAVDENCDKDKDGFCDAALITVGKPAVCLKGGGDCADGNPSINPGQAEVCGNAVDENCDGSTNGQDAVGCTNFFLDGDNDAWAVNVSQCWCVPTGNYKGSGNQLGDCDDTVATVNPGVKEVCGDGLDNNCNGTQNDIGASSCINHYQDGDKDGFGAGAAQCQCFPEGAFITAQGGDCDDGNADKFPANPEQCDALDNNCLGNVDEGCDDDGDGWCDGNLKTKGQPPACPSGGGDCNDLNNTIKPNAVETCDNVDQNCVAGTDEGCDDDKDGFCDAAMSVLGKPPICNQGGGDCDDANSLVRPGKPEICDDADNNCAGGVDEGCDDDGDKYCDAGMSVIGAPAACFKGGGDCLDTSAAVNPGSAEICDGLDNNCAGGTDETCKDTDGDGYCVGNVAVSVKCPKGGNDCDDSKSAVNPGATETCATGFDDNCDGNANPLNAVSCINFYADGDGDGYGVGTPDCYCVQAPGKTALLSGDCDDAKPAVNPTGIEICDGLDNDCKAGVDDGCDGDNDGYCNVNKLMAASALCAKSVKPAAGQTKAGDDCNDSSASAFPGGSEVCDDLDNDCNGSIDEGCDDDNDNYCQSGLGISSPPPSTCTAGGSDCDDGDVNVKPGGSEICTTAADDNCNGVTNEQGAAGCTNYYLDVDGDGYGTGSVQCWCGITGNYRATKGGDCNDNNPTVYPNNLAEQCDGADNNCNSIIDEGCDDDGDQFCDKGMGFAGNPPICPNGGGDCDDNSKFVNPSAAELCDDSDNNCNASVDEGCNVDGDGYCASNKVVVGLPAVCNKGGGDCDDTKPTVNPATVEVCDGADNNCNNQIDEAGAAGCKAWFFDGDQDGWGTNSSQCLCGADGLFTTQKTGDCNDTCPTCAPGKPELCDGVDNNCNGAVDENCNKDGDAYCDSAMVTVGTPPVCNKGGGDCNDFNATVSPGALEACNNQDDNCNGIIDENASDACIGFPNAITGCVAGQCVIKNCMPGFYNLNSSVIDGCECNGSDQYEPNDTCASAYVVNNDMKDTGIKASVTGRLVDTNDTDWYAVLAKDNADGGYAACDQFNMRAVFLANPGGSLRFDIWRGSCPAGGTNSVCCGSTDFNWFTNFKGSQNGEPSRQWSEWGECPCQTGNQFDRSNYGWDRHVSNGGPYCKDINNGYVCVPTGYYFTQCQDNSSWFYVRVYKSGGAPSCTNYTIEFSNALYGQPGTGYGRKGP